jgi:hypothetical protein
VFCQADQGQTKEHTWMKEYRQGKKEAQVVFSQEHLEVGRPEDAQSALWQDPVSASVAERKRPNCMTQGLANIQQEWEG